MIIITSVPQANFFSALPFGGQAKNWKPEKKDSHSVQFYMMH